MKKLRYIFLLLIAVLSGFAISSCEDDDVVAAEVTEEATEGSGETVKTTFTISLSAPDVSADLDPVTRAGDNANIEYAKPENGGRFQNIVVVLTDADGYIKGVLCHNWADNVGVKEYNVIFSDVEVPAADVTNKKQYKVYAFGNVCEDHYKILSGEASAKVGHKLDNNRVFNTESNGWPNMFSYCISPTLSVEAEDIYKISFVPGEYKYKVGSVLVKSTGMPVNNSATATVVKGNTQFNVALKRVCARLQVTFRNFTGTYIDYETSTNKENNVYVDKFEIKNVLTNKANYFCNNTTSVTGVTSSNFDILQALGGSKTNDHIINKIENGKDLVVSMYVFENNKGVYQYDLKVDRGKSLGLNTTTIDPENAYVIWNNQKHHSIAYKDSKICASREQTSKDNIPFSDQVFWKIESAPDAALASTYVLKHCDYESSTDKATPEEKYLKQQGEPTDWGIHYYCSKHNTTLNNFLDIIGHYIGALFSGGGCNISNQLVPGGFKHTFVNAHATSTTDAQYVNFVLDKTSDITQSRFTLNLLNDKEVTVNRKKTKQKYTNVNYWSTESERGQTSYNYLFLAVENSTLGCSRGAAFNTAGTLDNYDWTLYAKYIIKNGETFKDKAGNISQIERNHSYELDFSVMPNYDTKQEILVNCVRKQNEINWSEVEK